MDNLSLALDRYYEQSYSSVVHQGVGGRVQALFHRAVELPFNEDFRFGKVVELGATSGEHLRFVRHSFDRYVMLDIRDSEIARHNARRFAEERGASVEFVVGDAQHLSGMKDESVDRLISMCLLHHLPDPVTALTNWRRVVKPGGHASIFLPCDPGFLWRLGRAITSFRAARKAGYSSLEVRYINACDHRNHVASLLWMLKGIFQEDELRVHKYPLPFGGWNPNLFFSVQIRRATDASS